MLKDFLIKALKYYDDECLLILEHGGITAQECLSKVPDCQFKFKLILNFMRTILTVLKKLKVHHLNITPHTILINKSGFTLINFLFAIPYADSISEFDGPDGP